jgi:hypothetical protein
MIKNDGARWSSLIFAPIETCGNKNPIEIKKTCNGLTSSEGK